MRKQIFKPWSIILLLIAVAIAMIVLIVVIPVVNPANKPMKELIPVIIMCSVVSAICLSFIIYFLVPKKSKSTNEDFHMGEKIFWEGNTTKAGGILFTAKIVLFVALLLEIICGIIAAFFDIGIQNKWQAFGILQIPVAMISIMIFFLGSFQAVNFSYTITDKWIYISGGKSFGHGGKNLITAYAHKDIVDLQLKNAFYERDKQHGTINVKLRGKRLAPLKNHLYSIPEPEKVLELIENCIELQKAQEAKDIEKYIDYYSRANGYKADIFKTLKCKMCQEDIFIVETKQEKQLYRAICKNCSNIEYIENSGDFWEDSEEESIELAYPDGHNSFNITLGFMLRKDKSKKWLYIGYVCNDSKTVGCFDDIKLP